MKGYSREWWSYSFYHLLSWLFFFFSFFSDHVWLDALQRRRHLYRLGGLAAPPRSKTRRIRTRCCARCVSFLFSFFFLFFKTFLLLPLVSPFLLPYSSLLTITPFPRSLLIGAVAAFQKHVSELRTKCLVKVSAQFGSASASSSQGSHSLQMTFINGLSASVHVCPYYPEVPNGVFVSNLVGVGGWPASELEELRAVANSSCFCSLHDLFDLLASRDSVV